MIGRHDHANAVADLQHELRRRHEIDVIASNMQDLDRDAGRNRQIGQSHARHVGFRDEEPLIGQIPPILGDPSWLQPTECSSRLGDGGFFISHDQKRVAVLQSNVGVRQEVPVFMADARDLHTVRQRV